MTSQPNRPQQYEIAHVLFVDFVEYSRLHLDDQTRLIAGFQGIHSGPVTVVEDINGNRNAQGPGMNIAERVMDCGDAGHILLSSTVAELLGQLGDWATFIHDLGECEVKHGARMHLFNLYTEGL